MPASEQEYLSSPLLGDRDGAGSMRDREGVEQKTLDATATAPPITDNHTDENHSFLKNPAQVSSMISNFSTSYNVVNISLVLPILDSLYTVSEEQDATCASSLLAGMVVGQLAGGALGDSFLGRLGALKVVMAFQVVASIGSAVLWGPHLLFWLAVFRFLNGVGCGGVYPLAAVLSAEQDNNHALKIEDETPQERMQQLRRVVLTFSMQGVGFLAVPVLTVPLLYVTDNVNLVWRIILGSGSLPGLLLVCLQYRMYKSASDTQGHDMVAQQEPSVDVETTISADEIATNMPNQDDTPQLRTNEAESLHTRALFTTRSNFAPIPDNESHHDDGDASFADNISHSSTVSLWGSIRHEPHLVQKLLGTAGTWFLFDVLFYGNTLFEPVVMETAFGGGSNDVLKKAATDSLILACIALPGYILSAFVMGRRVCYVTQTPRFVQMQGFVAMSLLYSIVGAYWSYLKRTPWLLVILYGSTFFFANYGPNTTTFALPSLVYSPDCRSTLNGISAAFGKAGALLGATMFEPVSEKLGDDKVMLICAGVSVLAFAMTRFFVRLPPVNPEV